MWLGGMRNGISLLAGKEMQRSHRKRAGNVLWNTYKCQDGKWIAFSMSQGDRYWPVFCKALDRLDLIENKRFNTTEVRAVNNAELIEILDEIFVARTRDEWEKRLVDAGRYGGLAQRTKPLTTLTVWQIRLQE